MPRSSVPPLMLLVLLLTARVSASSVTVTVESLQVAAGGTSSVPINVEGAKDIGAMHLELAYDPSVLSAETVENGPAARSAMLEFNTGTAGRVVIGLISLDGIQGDGALATVKFRAIGQAGQKSALTLERCRAWEAKSHFDIVANTRSGEAKLAGGSRVDLPPFVLPAAIALLAVVGILVMFLVMRGRKNRQKTTARQSHLTNHAQGFAPALTGRLVVTGGGVTKPGIDLPAEGLTIGRSASNQLVLNDGQASGQHALLSLVEGQWIIQDLNSTNGTYVNGERLTASRALRSGDRVQIGQVNLVFVSP